MLVQCTCHKCSIWWDADGRHTDYWILHWLVFDVVHLFFFCTGVVPCVFLFTSMDTEWTSLR
jgi:hypothetical protein